MIFLWILLALFALFCAIVLFRTLRFRPAAAMRVSAEEADVDEARVSEHLAALIRCKTVSSYAEEEIDFGEFEKVQAHLRAFYPTLYERASFEKVGKTGLLFCVKGRSNEKPAVLMAHYDVVPVNEDAWAKPPFDAVVEDGVMWGRGTLDTKSTFLSALEAAEAVLKEGFTPENDLYLAFAGDEEVAGKTQPMIVELLKSRGVTPALVLDEGGAIVTDVFPGVNAPCALIGVAEKGLMDAEFSIDEAGGHASAPPRHTSLGRLAKTILDVENKPFPCVIPEAARRMFDTLGRHSTFVYRMIFANLWCFSPLLNALCVKRGGELNALMRTTVAFTMAEGSKTSNVLPPRVSATANLRLVTGDSDQYAIEQLRKRVSDQAVRVRIVQSMNPSKCSPASGYGWERIKAAVNQTWPEAIVSPYLMIACSDSRHYGAISENVYRFGPMPLSREERASIHGNNERIRLTSLNDCVRFYIRLIRTL